MSSEATAKERLEQLCNEEPDTFWTERYQRRKKEWNAQQRSHYDDIFGNVFSSLTINLHYARDNTGDDEDEEEEAREIVTEVEEVIATLAEYDALLEQHLDYRQKETQTREGAFPQLKANTLERAHYIAESRKLLEGYW